MPHFDRHVAQIANARGQVLNEVLRDAAYVCLHLDILLQQVFAKLGPFSTTNKKGSFMPSSAIYRVESAYPMFGPLLPTPGSKFLTLVDRAMAVVLAAKSKTTPPGHEIRVVYVPTGQVVFRKSDAAAAQ